MTKIGAIYQTLKQKGSRGIADKLKIKRIKSEREREYQRWVREFGTISVEDRDSIAREITDFALKPLISIVMPVYEVDEKWLRLCIESVCRQVYENWELCIADDFSQSPHIRKVLEEYRAQDSRLKVIYRSENGHISCASNSALSLATGEFIALLDNDDELAEDALFEVVKEINQYPAADLIYSDEDKIDENNRRFDPTKKPIWNPDLFYSMNFVNHLSVYRRQIVERIGGFRIGFEGSQDYDLTLRFVEQIPPENIRHIPKILYHWRAIAGSTALESSEKSYAHERARAALREHFQRKNEKVHVTQGFQNYHRVMPLWEKEIEFEIFEISDLGKARNSLADVLIFMDKKVKPCSDRSFTELANQAMREEIGAVGGVLLNQNQTINNCGIIGGEYVNQGLPKDFFGTLASGKVLCGVDAVVGCLAIRRELFDPEFPPDSVQICEILRGRKYRILFTPDAEFIITSL